MPCPIRQADEAYQVALERGETMLTQAKLKAREMWTDDRHAQIALEDYVLTTDDIKAMASLRTLAMAPMSVSPAVLQAAILKATDGMNDCMVSQAFDYLVE